MRALNRLSATALLIALFLCLPSQARASQKNQVALNDAKIKGQVEHKVAELDLGTGHVAVAVKDGVVTLSGTVPSAWIKAEAIDRAHKADDVASVVSELSVMKAESDDALAKEVANRVRRYVFYTVYDDIEGTVRGGVVTLTGVVTAPYKANEVADLAARVHGVQEVRNEIKAMPVSTFDDQLRFTIASRIYREPMFWNYGIQANPPIHVVVDNGRVTLTGVVNSEVERRKAESIARTTFGSFAVENKLRLDSEVPTSTR